MKRLLPFVLAGLLLLSGCSGNTRELEQEITRLKQENNALQEQVASLREQLSALQSTSLDRFTLTATGTTQEDPVSVHAELWPGERSQGQKAQILVTLEGKQVLLEDCLWDGACYGGSFSLEPADGYSYYCVLTALDGTQEQIPLSTPENPKVPRLTYLLGSLSAYANAVATNASVEDGKIRADVTASVQVPLITRDGSPATPLETKLGWYRDGSVLSEEPLAMTEGEAEGSYTAQAHAELPLPELKEGDQIDLILSAALPDGRVLAGVAGSWVYGENGLEFSVG